MNTSDPLEIPPMNQTNDKREPMETRNGQNSCSGSHSDSIDSTDRDHEKDKTALCIAQETLDTSDMEDPSIEGEQNKVSNYVAICFQFLISRFLFPHFQRQIMKTYILKDAG